jgi:hypothetical protein
MLKPCFRHEHLPFDSLEFPAIFDYPKWVLYVNVFYL